MYKVLLKKKYQFIHEVKKAGLLTAFALLTGLLYAQEEQEEVPVMDSSVSIITEEVQEDGSYGVGSGSNSYESDYFDQKWEHEGTWDSLYGRKLPEREIAKLKDDDDFWYANFEFPKEEEETPQAKPRERKRFSLSLYDSILWLVTVLGFIAFLVIYLMNSNVNMFRRTKDVGFEESDPDLDDIFGINYDKEIEKAVNAGNHRLAVRLMFLRLLRNLTDKNIIQYKHDRTNFDYLMQLGNTKWYDPFRILARHYEYVWYGKFAIDERQFEILRSEFNNLEKQL
jgi:hypothetical protein